MVTRLPAARRRRQLLDVALEAFGTRGFHATSMDDVAEAAGVTKPVLYQHFRSKGELYLELLEDVGRQLMEAITSAADGVEGPRQRVEAGFTAYFRFVAEQENAFRLLFSGGARRDAVDGSEDDELVSELLRRVEEPMAETVSRLIVADIDDDHRRLLGAAIVGIAEGASRQWLKEGMSGTPELMAQRLSDLAWAGLRGIHRS